MLYEKYQLGLIGLSNLFHLKPDSRTEITKNFKKFKGIAVIAK